MGHLPSTCRIAGASGPTSLPVAHPPQRAVPLPPVLCLYGHPAVVQPAFAGRPSSSACSPSPAVLLPRAVRPPSCFFHAACPVPPSLRPGRPAPCHRPPPPLPHCPSPRNAASTHARLQSHPNIYQARPRPSRTRLLCHPRAHAPRCGPACSPLAASSSLSFWEARRQSPSTIACFV